MATRKKFQDMEVHHRGCDILMKYMDGFAPVWEAYVRWPGYKNRKYFTSVGSWKHLPSGCIEIVKKRIDASLCQAWVDITTSHMGTHRYQIQAITDSGMYNLKERTADGKWIRFNPDNNNLEFLSENTWNVYISKECITHTAFWDEA